MDAVYAVAVQVDIPKLMSDAVKGYKTCKTKKSFLMPRQFLQQRNKGFYSSVLRGDGAAFETSSEELSAAGVPFCILPAMSASPTCSTASPALCAVLSKAVCSSRCDVGLSVVFPGHWLSH